jgi:hypothetical protein
MFETPCPDCKTSVAFPELPGDATCPACGLRLYVTDNQAIGRYPDTGWEPGGIQGRRKDAYPGGFQSVWRSVVRSGSSVSPKRDSDLRGER